MTTPHITRLGAIGMCLTASALCASIWAARNLLVEPTAAASEELTPADFFAAVPPSGERALTALGPASTSILRAEAGTALQHLAVRGAPHEEVIFWARDHGSFSPSGHYVARATADADGIAAVDFRTGDTPGLYRVDAASRAAAGCVTFYVHALPRSRESRGPPLQRTRTMTTATINALLVSSITWAILLAPSSAQSNSADCNNGKQPENCHECEKIWNQRGELVCPGTGGNLQFAFGAYHHTIVDYAVDPLGASACATCSTSMPAPESSTVLPALRLDRHYDSRGSGRIGWFGRFWSTELENAIVVVRESPTTRLALVFVGWNRFTHFREEQGRWEETTLGYDAERFFGQLEEMAPGQFRYTEKHGSSWWYEIDLPYQPSDPHLSASCVARADANGNAVTLARGANGRPETIRDAYGQELRLRWARIAGTAIETVHEVIRPDGLSISYEYDAAFPELLRRVRYPNGEVASYERERNATGDVVLVFNDPLGHPGSRKHRVAIHANDQQAYRVQEPSGTMLIERLQTNRDAIEIRQAGGVSQVKRWRDGHLLEGLLIAGGTGERRFVQGPRFLIQSTTDELGRTKAFTYDGKDEVATRTHPDGTTERWSRDPRHGRVVSYADRLGRKTGYTYDLGGNLLSKTYPDGRVERYEYDARGLILRAIDRLGAVTRYEYDSRGYLRATILPDDDADPGNDPRWSYGRDAIGRMDTVIDPVGRRTSFTYDVQHRLLETTFPDGSTERNVYGTGSVDPRDPVGTWGLLVSKKDRNGRWTTFDFDSNDRLVRVTREDGSTTSHTYVPGTDWIASTIEDGDASLYSYDVRGRKISETTAPDHQTLLVKQFRYDEQDRLVEMIDPYGRSIRYRYDDDDRVVGVEQEVAPGEVVRTSARYDAVGRLIEETDGRGHLRRYEYDTNDHLERVYEPAPYQHLFTSYTYDAVGNRTSTTDPGGHTTHVKWSARRQPLVVVDPSGQRTERTYTLADELASITNPATGKQIQLSYDCCGRVAQKRTRVDGASLDVIESFEYDGNGNGTAWVDGEGNRRIARYDVRNRAIALVDPTGGITEYRYGEDASTLFPARFAPGQGAWVQRRDATGRAWTIIVDGVGREVVQRDPAGHESIAYHDQMSAGLVVRELLDAEGGRTIQKLDALVRVRETIDPLGHLVVRDFDAMGNLVRIVDARGATSTYTFDERGLLRSESRGGNPPATTHYEYDDAGWRTARIDAGDSRTEYVYDAAGRLLERRYPDRLDDLFEYDGGGRLVRATSQRHRSTIQRAYDAADRLIAEFQDGYPVAYAYDRLHQPSVLLHPSGLAVTYERTADGDLESVGVFDVPLVSYAYDAARRPLRLRRVNGVETRFGYDASGRVETLEDSRGSSALQSWRYAHDRNGLRTLARDLVHPARSETAGFDAWQRLVVWRRGLLDAQGQIPAPTQAQAWDLDANGNWTSIARDAAVELRTHDLANQINSIGAVALQYDARGNLVDDGVRSFAYDPEDRLVSISQGAQVLYRFRYDAVGRRIELEDSTRGERIRAVWDRQRIAEEWQEGVGLRAIFLHGDWEAEPLVLWNAHGLFFTHRDPTYATVALSDLAGGIAERIAYDAYGAPTTYDGSWSDPRPSSRVQSPFGFAGLRLLGDSGLYEARHRAYAPRLGRFLQRDPVGYTKGFNLYEYALSNPLQWMDPSGLLSVQVSLPLDRDGLGGVVRAVRETKQVIDAFRGVTGGGGGPVLRFFGWQFVFLRPQANFGGTLKGTAEFTAKPPFELCKFSGSVEFQGQLSVGGEAIFNPHLGLGLVGLVFGAKVSAGASVSATGSYDWHAPKWEFSGAASGSGTVRAYGGAHATVVRATIGGGGQVGVQGTVDLRNGDLNGEASYTFFVDADIDVVDPRRIISWLIGGDVWTNVFHVQQNFGERKFPFRDPLKPKFDAAVAEARRLAGQ